MNVVHSSDFEEVKYRRQRLVIVD